LYFAGISTGAWLGLSALELMQAMEREKRHQAMLNQQLETQRQLGKNEAEIEALQRQIREQNEKLNSMASTLQQKQNA
jgi:TolA-binding protein